MRKRKFIEEKPSKNKQLFIEGEEIELENLFKTRLEIARRIGNELARYISQNNSKKKATEIFSKFKDTDLHQIGVVGRVKKFYLWIFLNNYRIFD